MYANTLQCRAAINAAIKELHAFKGSTWTDCKNWGCDRSMESERIVGYVVSKHNEVHKLAQAKLTAAGFQNVIRIGEYGTLRVNCELA